MPGDLPHPPAGDAAPEPPGATGHTDLDAHLAGPAPGTRAAMAVIGAVSVADWLFPGARIGEWLCKDSEAILAGQIWRLVTVALVHGGAVHLFFNLSVLAGVGRLVERLAGTGAMLAVLFLGTAAGSLASTAFLPGPSVGASGGVLALAAAGGAFVWRRREVLPPEARKRMVRAATELLLLNAVLTLVLPRVDWAGHAGGMLAGALLGLRLAPSPELRRVLGGGDQRPPNGLVR
jgi:MYXO-CTERM domain-containing protein